jgi:DNA-binding IclR family transcriptional regulator
LGQVLVAQAHQDRDTAHRELRELVRQGLVQRRGQGRGTHYTPVEDRTISG